MRNLQIVHRMHLQLRCITTIRRQSTLHGREGTPIRETIMMHRQFAIDPERRKFSGDGIVIYEK